MKRPKKNDVFRPIEGNTFLFSCHRDIPCFTKCCAKLHLILTPYDVLRMKNRLGLSSDEFLEKYTDPVVEDHSRFPTVKLKMKEDEQQACPFVTTKGCIIYEDRPGACRIYPLGRAASKPDGAKHAREKFFIVDEDHCLGTQEQRRWTVVEWLENEGLDEYNAMNDQWLEIITSSKGLGSGSDIPRKIQMFFMASYNLDKFRKFVFETKFLEVFQLASDLKEKISRDDVALMKLAFDWLKFSLFGDKALMPKSHDCPC
jgi:Fe-S-cluster containining protein